jgi:hypothetical protein
MAFDSVGEEPGAAAPSTYGTNPPSATGSVPAPQTRLFPYPSERLARPADGLSRSVAGSAVVELAELRRRLGDAAFWVLVALWASRDPKTGDTVVTRASLASGLDGKFAGLPSKEKGIRSRIDRLRTAGLVVSLGRVDFQGRRLQGHRVFGGYATGVLSSENLVFVPRKTETWLRSGTGWGGRREGAGRPMKNSRGADLKIQEGPISHIQEGPISHIQEGPISHIQEGPISIQEGPISDDSENSRGADKYSLDLDLLSLSDLTSSDTRIGERRALSIVPLVEREGPIGLAFGGTTTMTPRVTMSSALVGVPPPPWTVCDPVTLPEPPTLPKESTDEERAERLAQTYQAVCRARYDVVWRYRRGAIARSKHFKMLRATGAYFVEKDIAPAAWVSWSFEVWRSMGNTKPPPIGWVFGMKRVEERRGWFSSEASSHGGGQLVDVPARRELVARWYALRMAILREGAWLDPSALVARYFPGKTWDRMARRAKLDAEATKNRLRAEADAGEFLW